MQLFDVVALLENLPEQGLQCGQVGTLVEQYEPNVFEVEFCDTKGNTYLSSHSILHN
jgi:hypothetical protein